MKVKTYLAGWSLGYFKWPHAIWVTGDLEPKKLPKDHKTLVSSNKGSWSKGTEDWRLMNVASALYVFLVVLTLWQSCTVRYPQGRAHLSPRFFLKTYFYCLWGKKLVEIGPFSARWEMFQTAEISGDVQVATLTMMNLFKHFLFGDVQINFKRKLLNFWHGFFSLQI